MLKKLDKFAETTDYSAYGDIVADALKSLHIAGSLLLREAYAPPWAVQVPGTDTLAGLLVVGKGERVVAFHLVEFGQCEIQPDGGESVLLQAGEMAVCLAARRTGSPRANRPRRSR